MKHKNLLKQLRNQLSDIKATTHDTVEPSVTREIEKAIESIDLILEDSEVKDFDYKLEALLIIGKFLSVLPSLVNFLNNFLE